MTLQGIDLWDMQATADEGTDGQLLPYAILGFAMIFPASQQKFPPFRTAAMHYMEGH